MESCSNGWKNPILDFTPIAITKGMENKASDKTINTSDMTILRLSFIGFNSFCNAFTAFMPFQSGRFASGYATSSQLPDSPYFAGTTSTTFVSPSADASSGVNRAVSTRLEIMALRPDGDRFLKVSEEANATNTQPTSERKSL